jgi:hypothetical protein
MSIATGIWFITHRYQISFFGKLPTGETAHPDDFDHRTQKYWTAVR